jgi:ABC-type uncharacterized transport system permease subunit
MNNAVDTPMVNKINEMCKIFLSASVNYEMEYHVKIAFKLDLLFCEIFSQSA